VTSTLRFLWLMALVLGLVACAARAPRITASTAQRDLTQLQHWQATGRLAVSTDKGGGSGSFDWQQDDDRALVQLAGPAGIGRLRLTLQGSDLSMESANGATFAAEAAWAELEARLGVRVPADYLRYWIRGLPAPGEYRWLAREPVPILEQAGWHIEYQQYGGQGALRVPVKFNASAGAARLRVIIDSWQLGGS
jgi:outer membrane lipoprotein LolB